MCNNKKNRQRGHPVITEQEVQTNNPTYTNYSGSTTTPYVSSGQTQSTGVVNSQSSVPPSYQDQSTKSRTPPIIVENNYYYRQNRASTLRELFQTIAQNYTQLSTSDSGFFIDYDLITMKHSS